MIQQGNPLPKPTSVMPKISQPVKPPVAPAAVPVKPPAPPSMPGVPAPMKPAMPTAMPTKTADALDSAAKLVTLVGEDAVTLMARKLFQGGQQVAKIPAVIEKAHAIDDPSYRPNSTYSAVAKVLGGMSKMSNLQFLPGRSPETAAKWELDKRNISAAFDTNGPAFRNDPPAESTNIATGSQVKEGSILSTQTNRPAVDQTGTGNLADMVLSHQISGMRGSAATGSLDVNSAVSKAFSGMRVFENADDAPLNGPTEGALQS
jgi:hypothetical protein